MVTERLGLSSNISGKRGTKGLHEPAPLPLLQYGVLQAFLFEEASRERFRLRGPHMPSTFRVDHLT